jgi:exosortase H (IPTLxxWG-CTERM-specific)
VRRFALVFAAIVLAAFAAELTPWGQLVVRPWTAFVAEASSALIRAFDGDALSRVNVLYSRSSGFGIAIEAGCNGVEAQIVLLAGMLAYPAPWRYRLAGLAIGSVAIQALNLVRIVSLYYLGQWNKDVFEWAHLYLWQALIMLDALIVWLLWIRAVDRAGARSAPA